MNSLVRSHHASVFIDDDAVARGVGSVLLHEARVIVVGNEADLLAVRLVGDGQPALARVGAHGVLRPIAHRKNGATELILRERKQEVRLILCRIRAALQEKAAGRRIALDPRVMAGRHGVGAEAARPIDERGELQVAVAMRAGQRRASRRVLADEVRDDLLVELLLEVDDVMRDVDGGGDAPRIVEIVERAAAAERRLAVGLIVQLHRHADDVVALLGEQRRSHR